jgi:hypothetical protein
MNVLLSDWLKTTIPGIILLGAAGSIVALWLGKFFLPLLLRALRLPVTLYQGRRRYQAYVLGFSRAEIENDQSGRLLATFLIFHLAKFLFLIALALTSWLSFLAFIAYATYPTLTYIGSASIIVVLLSLYRAYYEFCFIDRYFLGHWGEVLLLADDSIRDWRARGSPREAEEERQIQSLTRDSREPSLGSTGAEPEASSGRLTPHA